MRFQFCLSPKQGETLEEKVRKEAVKRKKRLTISEFIRELLIEKGVIKDGH
jgi:hypothetical protein